MNNATLVLGCACGLATGAFINVPTAVGVRSYCTGVGCTTNGGAYVGLSESETAHLPPKTATGGTVGGKAYKPGTVYQYSTVLRCDGNGPDHQEFICPNALNYCQQVQQVPGPWVFIYRRVDTGADVYGPWEQAGTTCYPDVVPGKRAPQLTLAMIEHAWSVTPFAKPQVSIQPVGNRTLVTLPTYFRASWPDAGYAPGEVRTVTLVGHAVRIKPTLKSNTFDFGDGSTSGPTRSMGGTYPAGDIRHAYDAPGSFTTSVRTTYGGQYSVDGGAWADLPGTTVVAGPAEPLRVLTSTNRLY